MVVVHLTEQARVEGFVQRTQLLEKRLAMQDQMVAQLKEQLTAKPDAPIWKPHKVVVFEPAHPTPLSIALCGILAELSVEFESQPQQEHGPVLEDDGLLFWDTKSAMCHIASSSGIPSWYPKDPEARTRCHEALYLHAELVTPLLLDSLLDPAMRPEMEHQQDDNLRSSAVLKLRQTVWPRIAGLLERGGGRTIGGASPCLADLVLGISLCCAQLRLPELSDLWSDKTLTTPIKARKANLRDWAQ
eukprot:TRINITY_DN14706_c0_g5_i1.p1 TRINITY_DN14706_c0_g5~~TRINITY_DN14706_c0_g5_i1.p1  ORF type:complete len:245 (-),score=58.73 TRINITY_DN14706_c0_g5_i1:24-758(-)